MDSHRVERKIPGCGGSSVAGVGGGGTGGSPLASGSAGVSVGSATSMAGGGGLDMTRVIYQLDFVRIETDAENGRERYGDIRECIRANEDTNNVEGYEDESERKTN